MGILDQIINMKKQGILNDQIMSELSQQGNSPSDIMNAMKQAEIKNAVSGYSDSEEEMQPSIMPEGEAPSAQPRNYQEQIYQPQQPQQYQQESYSPQTQEQPQYYPQEQYYSPEQSYQEYPAQTGSTDMMMEVADQVFSEKIKKTQKLAESTSEATALLQNKIENISDRLKKIENTIDKLQIAILEKVGSYGQNLESVKKEMSMMQDSFSKMISAPRQREETKHKKTSKKK